MNYKKSLQTISTLALNLEVTDEQKSFFPVPPVYWLAESAYCGMIPLSLYAKGELVGFTVYAMDPDDRSCWIMEFMEVDRNDRESNTTTVI